MDLKKWKQKKNTEFVEDSIEDSVEYRLINIRNSCKKIRELLNELKQIEGKKDE